MGLLYSAFTYYLGFTVNSGEYKLMGLAPYGNAGIGAACAASPTRSRASWWTSATTGRSLLNMEYFDFATGLRMVNEAKWERLFGVPRRAPEAELTQAHMDMALAIQQVTEEIVLRLARTARAATGCRHLVMAGGVALNCVANGKLLASGIFDDIWIQPAAGDAGGARGRGLRGLAHSPRQRAAASTGRGRATRWRARYLGPEFSPIEMPSGRFARHGARAQRYGRLRRRWPRDVAGRLAAGQVVGWFQGRMEFGPRALGNRSILGDARNPEMQKRLNLKMKFREGFRPFAPSVLEEDVGRALRAGPAVALHAAGGAGARGPAAAAAAGLRRGAALRPALLPAVATCRRSRTWTTRRASRR